MNSHGMAPLYRGSATVSFPAAHSLAGLEAEHPASRAHGHDYNATFLFETGVLAYPGVVIDEDLRAVITGHVQDRLAYRDLDRLLDRPATCEAIAEHLAAWFLRSARPADHARLVSVAVATGSGACAEIHLRPPHPGPGDTMGGATVAHTTLRDQGLTTC